MSVTAARAEPAQQPVRRWLAVVIVSVVYLLVLLDAYLQVGPYWIDRLTRVWPFLLVAVLGLAAFAAVTDFMAARRTRALRGVEVAAATAATVVGVVWVGCAVALVLFGGAVSFWPLSVAVAFPVVPVAALGWVSWLSRRHSRSGATGSSSRSTTA